MHNRRLFHVSAVYVHVVISKGHFFAQVNYVCDSVVYFTSKALLIGCFKVIRLTSIVNREGPFVVGNVYLGFKALSRFHKLFVPAFYSPNLYLDSKNSVNTLPLWYGYLGFQTVK